jgi:hypothetical protein
MARRLGKISTLAAFGEFARLEGADNALGIASVNRVGNGGETSHGAGKNGPALIAIQNAFIEKGFEYFDGNDAASKASGNAVGLVQSDGHDSAASLKDCLILQIERALSRL